MSDETKPDANQPQDKLLGMDRAISRRDFLNASLLASGGLLMTSASPLQLLSEDDWTGYGGVGDYSRSNGNTYEIVQAGHRIRDGEFEKIPAAAIDTREVYDCVVVGGGISGLAAALFFLRQAGAGRKCLVLDNHPIFGGEAKGNEFLVDGHRLLGASRLGGLLRAVSAQLYRALLRFDRAEGAQVAISIVGRIGAGDSAQQDPLRYGRQRAGHLRILFWREIWRRRGRVVD